MFTTKTDRVVQAVTICKQPGGARQKLLWHSTAGAKEYGRAEHL